jgi:hypothetical protein
MKADDEAGRASFMLKQVLVSDFFATGSDSEKVF